MNDIDNKLQQSAQSISPPETTGSRMLSKVKMYDGVTEPVVKQENKLSFWKNGVGAITAAVIVLAIVVPVAALIMPAFFSNDMEAAINRLKGTFVDMNNVAAFGVWNAASDNSVKPSLSKVSYVVSEEQLTAQFSEKPDSQSSYKEASQNGENSEGDGKSDYYWENDEKLKDLYDWESDYDWDPTRANVLVSIDEDGCIKEVVYERENDRGQIRQNTLGNAAMVYVSRGFTYVMYVDDDEWDFWKDCNFAQETIIPNGFHCHHERMQTIVIHNATGKVFALKDLIGQVSEISGKLNYTMQVHPAYDDYLYVDPMYGNSTRQFYNVVYNEDKGVSYEFVHFEHEKISSSSYVYQGVKAVGKDKYGQEYIYAENVNVSELQSNSFYCVNDKKMVFNRAKTILQGTDERMYAFDNGVLKVFGEGFDLSPVTPGLNVSLETLVEEDILTDKGVSYRLEDGYLYSMFGTVWSVDENGKMSEWGNLPGEFPVIAAHGYLIGGEIIVFVFKNHSFNKYLDGKVVRLSFGLVDGVPGVRRENVVEATDIIVLNHRMTIVCNKYYSDHELTDRETTKYYVLRVKDGKVFAEYVAYDDESMTKRLVKPVIDPLEL